MDTHKKHSQIIEFIDKLSVFLSSYYLAQLQTAESLDIITEIIEISGKKIGEAAILFMSSLKHIGGNGGILTRLEAEDGFHTFLKANRSEILKSAVSKKIQANFPERALPLFDIFNKKLPGQSIAVIELGASYGLLGQCLLSPAQCIENKERYFPPGQKIPTQPRPIDEYIGIELDPPEKEWLFACIWDSASETRLKNFTGDISRPREKFKLLKANALDFSRLDAVKQLENRPLTIVVLISFLFFQLDEKTQDQLKNEVITFTRRTGSHWINQSIELIPGSSDSNFFAEWDGTPMIQLQDERCTDWRWLS